MKHILIPPHQLYHLFYLILRSGTGADKKGLGVSEVHNLEAGDDEFDAYRKRMMMAYRFRPNPLVISKCLIDSNEPWVFPCE